MAAQRGCICRRVCGGVGLAVLASLPLGCRNLLGTDDFGTSQRFEACGTLEVRTSAGCQPVGVAACGVGFKSDGRGGCEPNFSLAECEAGDYVRPGLTGCAPVSASCPAGSFGAVSDAIGTTVYVGGVRADTPQGAHWVATLEAALAEQSGDLTIALAKGTHQGGVEISGRAVRIQGACATQTTIVTRDGGPAISLRRGTNGSSLEELAVTGASGSGISVSGAKDVLLRRIWVHDLKGPGVVFDDAEGRLETQAQYFETSGVLQHCLVERATDIAVGAYGASLELREVQISETLPLAPKHRAYGVVARPSPAFTLPNDTRVEQARHASQVTLTRSLVDRSRGAGVFVEGSSVEIDSTLIQGVEPDLSRHGRGIDVRAHTPGRVTARVVVRQSIVQDAHDVGIRAWNADKLSIEDSVIRDIGGAMSGRCLGNGLRARYDLVRDLGLTESRLDVRRTLVEHTRQAGIHIEGGSATIQDSLIRDTLAEPCREDFGDGVSVHASATGASRTSLQHTRIENAARAGVSSFDSSTSLDSVLIACSGAQLAGTGISGAEQAVCGCGQRLGSCRLAEATPSLIGGRQCRDDDTACYRGCSGTVFQSNQQLSQATVWAYDHDEIPSVVSDLDGCYEIEGLPKGEPIMLSVVHDERVPGLGLMAPLDRDSPRSYRTELLSPNLLPAGTALFGTPMDLRKIFVLLTRVCLTPKTPSDDNGNICKGVPGLTLSLSPGPSNSPIYFTNINQPDPSRSLKSTQGADVVFTNVAAAEHRISFEAPSGQTLACSPDVGGLGWMGAANQVRIVAEEGFTMFGAEVNCSIE
jgi:hypothetical protein